MQKLLKARVAHENPFHLHFAVQSHFGYLPFLARIFKAFSLKSQAILTQILVEAFNNAVVHAHHKNPSHWVDIELKWDRKQVTLRIGDEGGGLPHLKMGRKNSLWKTGGRGLALIEAFADTIRSFRKNGKHIFEVIYRYGKKST